MNTARHILEKKTDFGQADCTGQKQLLSTHREENLHSAEVHVIIGEMRSSGLNKKFKKTFCNCIQVVWMPFSLVKFKTTQVVSFPIQHRKQVTFTFDFLSGAESCSGKRSAQQVAATRQMFSSPRWLSTWPWSRRVPHLKQGNNSYLNGTLWNVIEIMWVTMLDPK